MSRSFYKLIAEIRSKIGYVIKTEEELRQEFIESSKKYLRSKNVDPIVEAERTVLQGRIDAKIGMLVLEFSVPIDSKGRPKKLTKGKINQIKNYMKEYRKKGIKTRGLVTNGTEVVFIDENREEVDRGDLLELSWMAEEWILALNMKVVEPEHIISTFGPPSPSCKAFIFYFWETLEISKESFPFVQECLTMWRGVYGCATNLNVPVIKAVKKYAKENFQISLTTKSQVEEFLFVLETYLSILMRFLIAKIAIQRNIIYCPSMTELFSPNPLGALQMLPKKIPILEQLFEYDAFYWFIDPTKQDKTLTTKLNSLISDASRLLDAMDLSEVTTDLMKRIYQNFFDPSTRIALGEFYTPDELVNEILDSIGYSGSDIVDKTILDPACGSGTFLVQSIRRFIASSKNELNRVEIITKITEQIIGIDIHPFAVAMAKANYLISIGNLIDPSTRKLIERIKIPVYWTDSLSKLATKQTFKEGEPLMTIRIKVPVLGEFELPNPADIGWETVIKATISALGADWKDNRYLQEFSEVVRLKYQEVLLQFLSIFRERKEKGLDGRWLSTLRNLLVVESYRKSCDLIVGNPPWVRIHNINPEIRETLKDEFVCYKKAGWKPKFEYTKVPFAIQVDYSIAFVEAGLKYLKEGGILGFVITSKILQSLYANRLRYLLLKDVSIMKLIDYSLSNRRLFEEATNYPLVLILKTELPSSEHRTEITVFNQKNERKLWQVTQKHLPLQTHDPESPWMIAPPEVIKIFRKIQKKNPLLGNRFEVNRGIVTGLNRIYIVEDFQPTTTEGIVMATTEGDSKILIEKELLKPVIRGENISEWTYSTGGYIIWTHDEFGKVLDKIPPNANTYFVKHRKKLLKRYDYKSNKPFWTIFRSSKQKLEAKVAWQELARRLECVCIPKYFDDDKLGTSLLIHLQTAYFLAGLDEQLRHAMCSILNSTLVRSYISSYAPRARGAYFRHFAWVVSFVPVLADLFKEKLKIAKTENFKAQLVELSTELHSNSGKITPLDMDIAVMGMYGLNESEMQKIWQYFEYMTA